MSYIEYSYLNFDLPVCYKLGVMRISSTNIEDTNVYDKWGISAQLGFQQIPNILFKNQAKLGLSAIELVVLLNVTLHWWEKNYLPSPRTSVIAKRIGVSRRTIERNIKSLEEKGFIRRRPRFQINTYDNEKLTIREFDLTGLVVLLEEFAFQELAWKKSLSKETTETTKEQD